MSDWILSILAATCIAFRCIGWILLAAEIQLLLILVRP